MSIKDFLKYKRKCNGRYLGNTDSFNKHTISKFSQYHCELGCYGHNEGVCVILENKTAQIRLNILLTEEETNIFKEILNEQIKNVSIDKKNRELEEKAMFGDNQNSMFTANVR